MLIRVPDYYHQFRCLAGACPHSCCEKWEVVIDEETAERYARESGALGEKLRSALCRDAEGDLCFPLNGGRCPFLDGENLCEIHRALGEEATSITCREHPRFTEDYGSFREITLSASCPAALQLLLESREMLTFMQWETEEETEEEDWWLPHLLRLRETMMAGLTDRRYPLTVRFGRFLRLADAAQTLLDAEEPEQAAALTVPETEENARLPEGALALLGELEVLDADWGDLLCRAEASGAAETEEPLLERIAVYFAFRYLLKCVNDGDLLSRAQLVVFAVLTVKRLAAVCGLEEALRRFSCEVEHSDENLDALLEAFRLRLPAEAFLCP